ncbi:hypothetical protein J4209_06430 [Candidatus Woesearchaeota archaeon]|nr:hypothetical protein [Candidatus Woesearchaeota archaeon]
MGGFALDNNELSKHIQSFIKGINDVDDTALLAEANLSQYGQRVVDVACSNGYKPANLLTIDGSCDPVVTLIIDYRRHFAESAEKIMRDLSVKGDFSYTSTDILNSRLAKELEKSEKELEAILAGNDPGAVRFAMAVRNTALNRLLVEIQSDNEKFTLPNLIKSGKKAIRKGGRSYRVMGIEHLLDGSVINGLTREKIPYTMIVPKNLGIDYSSLAKYTDGSSIVTFPRYAGEEGAVFTKRDERIGVTISVLAFLAIMTGIGFYIYHASQPRIEPPKKKDERPQIFIEVPSIPQSVYDGLADNIIGSKTSIKNSAIMNSLTPLMKKVYDEEIRVRKGWKNPLKGSNIELSPYANSLVQLAEQNGYKLYSFYSPDNKLAPDVVFFGFGHSHNVKLSDREFVLFPQSRKIYNEEDITNLLTGIANTDAHIKPSILSEGGLGRIETDSTDNNILFLTKDVIALLRGKGIPIYFDDSTALIHEGFRNDSSAGDRFQEIVDYDPKRMPSKEFNELVERYRVDNTAYFETLQKRNRNFFAQMILSQAEEGYMPVQFAGLTHMLMPSLLDPVKEAGHSYMVFLPADLNSQTAN